MTSAHSTGKLTAPADLNVSSTVDIIYLSWTAPSTLDITDVDPDISNYTVYIIDIATSTTNTTHTEYTFCCPASFAHQSYEFSVSAWNELGEGSRSNPMYGKNTKSLCTHCRKARTAAYTLIQLNKAVSVHDGFFLQGIVAQI